MLTERFATAAQQAIFERVSVWATEIFGEFAFVDQVDPAVSISHGSATVHVRVMPWLERDARVVVFSWVVTGVPLTPDLMYHLLQQNQLGNFGAFGVDLDGDVTFAHSIVGSTCDKQELRASVMAVALTADEADDAIVRRWGGKRSVDA